MSRKAASLFAVGALFDGLGGRLGSTYRKPNDEYHSLDSNRILASERELAGKIKKRFANRGISKVSDELEIMCQQSALISVKLAKPNWWLRSIQYLLILMLARSRPQPAVAQHWHR